MDDGKVKKLAEKTWWDSFKSAFKPVAARADENIQEAHENGPTQYDQDMQLPNQDRLKKVQKGFLGE